MPVTAPILQQLLCEQLLSASAQLMHIQQHRHAWHAQLAWGQALTELSVVLAVAGVVLPELA